MAANARADYAGNEAFESRDQSVTELHALAFEEVVVLGSGLSLVVELAVELDEAVEGLESVEGLASVEGVEEGASGLARMLVGPLAAILAMLAAPSGSFELDGGFSFGSSLGACVSSILGGLPSTGAFFSSSFFGAGSGLVPVLGTSGVFSRLTSSLTSFLSTYVSTDSIFLESEVI